MPRLTLFEFLNTYAPDREFVPIAGQKTTVGKFMDSLTAEEKVEEVTYRGSEEGITVFLGGRESGRLGMVVWPSSDQTVPACQEPEDYTKARLWSMDFMRKVEEVESSYHVNVQAAESEWEHRGSEIERQAKRKKNRRRARHVAGSAQRAVCLGGCQSGTGRH